LFRGYDPETNSCENITDLLSTEEVEADVFGGLEIRLSGGYRLQLFPAETSDSADAEQWRLFEPYGTHFVVRAAGIFKWQAPDRV